MNQIQSKQGRSILNTDESTTGLDENGVPVTLEAAKKLYHKNNNPFYFKKVSYENNEQATL